MTTELNTVVESIKQHLKNLESHTMKTVNFKWNDVNYSALKTDVNDIPAIKLTAKLGRLYLTVENGKKRDVAIKKILESQSKHSKNFSLYKDNRVTFETTTTYKNDISNGDYMTILAITLFDCEHQILDLKNYLKQA